MLIWILKCVMLLISLLGWCFLFQHFNCKVPIEYSPAITISIMSIVLLLAGYIDILRPVSIVIYVCGFGAFLFSCIKDKKRLKEHRTIGILLGAILIFAFLCYGNKFEEPDSYSHWGIMVKRMLLHNGLPDYTDKTIQYKSYPAGISSFLYYICLFTNDKDESMLLGMGIAVLSFLYAYFSLVKDKSKWYYVLIVVTGVVIMRCNNNLLHSVQVDTLLPVVGAVAFLMFHKLYQTTKQTRVFIYLVLILCFEITIKNSGIFFAILLSVTICFMYSEKNKWVLAGLTTGIPVLYYLLWSVHVKLAFPGGMTSTHAMSLQHYYNVLMNREWEEVRRTIVAFGERIINPFADTGVTVGLFLIIVIFLLLKVQKKKNMEVYRYYTRVGIVAYVSYMIGLLGMYLCSMEDDAPYILASFHRYEVTICIFIYLLMIECIIENDVKIRKKSKKETVIAYIKDNLCLICIGVIYLNAIQFVHMGYFHIKIDTREKMEKIVEQYNFNSNTSFAICNREDYDPYNIDVPEIKMYNAYMVQYATDSYNFKYLSSENMEEAMKNGEYDYYIFLEDDGELGIKLPIEGYRVIENKEISSNGI